MIKQSNLIVCLAQSMGVSRKNLIIMRLIARTGVPYLIWSGALMPGWDTDYFRERVNGKFLKFCELLFKKDYINSLITRIPRHWFGIPDANFTLQSSPGVPFKNPLIGTNTKRIHGHSPDYDVFQKENKKSFKPQKQAVFLDQFLPFHPDFVDSGTRSVDPKSYFADLRNLFSRVERDLDLKVVIAPHPRADYSKYPLVFGNREILNISTSQAVLESKLVIAGGTTAVSFAILAKKPLMLIATNQLYKVGIERNFIDALSEELGATIFWIDKSEELNLSTVLKFNQFNYDQYITKYIKTPNSSKQTLWEIVLKNVC